MKKFKVHMMYKNCKEVKAKTMEEHLKLKKKGYNHKKSKDCETKDGASVPLKGNQKNLSANLQKAILASDGASVKKPPLKKIKSKEAITGAIPKSGSMHEYKVDQTLRDDKELTSTMKEIMNKDRKSMSTQEAVDRNAPTSYGKVYKKAQKTMKPITNSKKKKKK